MKIYRTLLVAAALSLTVAAVAAAADSPHMGTWKLNEGKSRLAPGGAKNTMVTYTAAKGDMIKVAVEGMDKDGKPVQWTWTGKFDGQPHKVKGSAMVDSIAMKALNDHTNEMTVMKEGKVVMTGKITVAKDGKSRVVTSTMTDANGKKHTDKAYYDKQ